MNEEKRVLKIISDHLGVSPDEITIESELRSDLNAQDLEIADLLMKIEKEFSTQFAPEDVRELETIRDIIDLVKIS